MEVGHDEEASELTGGDELIASCSLVRPVASEGETLIDSLMRALGQCTLLEELCWAGAAVASEFEFNALGRVSKGSCPAGLSSSCDLFSDSVSTPRSRALQGSADVSRGLGGLLSLANAFHI